MGHVAASKTRCEAGIRAAAALCHSVYPVRELRTTIHSGEDFVHLVGGLRRVSEAVHYLDLHDGDRIGHGVALGVDVESWVKKTADSRCREANACSICCGHGKPECAAEMLIFTPGLRGWERKPAI